MDIFWLDYFCNRYDAENGLAILAKMVGDNEVVDVEDGASDHKTLQLNGGVQSHISFQEQENAREGGFS